MFTWYNYLVLCKFKVVSLILVTVLVGMLLAPINDTSICTALIALLGIALSASSAAVMNHVLDKSLDSIMQRTRNRPLPTESISEKKAVVFASLLSMLGMGLLSIFVNLLTAILTFTTLVGYAVVYTVYLKRQTTQNIVIGGLAGAIPPLLGWTAVTNHIDAQALLLVLIIFIWTPPHFWALALYRLDDYRGANIPMLPVIYGVRFTKWNILLYSILLFVVSLLPYLVGMSGIVYAVGAAILGLRFLYWSIKLYHCDLPIIAMNMFKFSIIYLLVIFILLIIDHYL